MQKEKSVIELVADTSAPANRDFAAMTGQEYCRRPTFFRHKETGDYSWLSCGLCWPVMSSSEKGCAVIIGSSMDDTPSFTVLDAGLSQTARGLVQECLRLRDKWGFRLSSELFRTWTGLPLFERMLLEANEKLDPGLIVNPPVDSDAENADQLYINTIQELTVDHRLKIGPVAVRDALRGMVLSDADKSLSDSPIVAAVAYTLHQMICSQSWLDHGDRAFNLEDADIGLNAVNLE